MTLHCGKCQEIVYGPEHRVPEYGYVCRDCYHEIFTPSSPEERNYDEANVIVMTRRYEERGQKVGALVDSKQQQYGDSFGRSGNILRVLYPNGVQPAQYDDMLAVVRIVDKLFRVANGNQGEENAWQDIAGYGLLGAVRVEASKT